MGVDPFAELCSGVSDAMERLSIPGAVLGVHHGGRQQIAAFGITSSEHPLPVTSDTLFQIGSITKTVLATALMRLVEQGQLELEAPLRSLLPDLRLADDAVAERVSLRHLLTHTGGWDGDFFADFGQGDDALARIVAAMVDLPQITPLGSVWSYNNAGFHLAGRVLERLRGQSLEQALSELVFQPLGMEHSLFFAQDVLTHRFACGHLGVGESLRVARPWALGRALHAAGGIVTCMGDLLRYARDAMGDPLRPDGSSLLSARSRQAMQSPLVAATGTTWMGLGWMVDDLPGGARMIGHGGGTNGQVSLLRIIPEHRFAVAVLTNGEQGGSLAFPLVEQAITACTGLELPKPAARAAAPEQLAPYLGLYASSAATCRFQLTDGQLQLHYTPTVGFPTADAPPPPAPPPVRFALYDDDRVIALDEPMRDATGEFLRGEDGGIRWFRFGGRLHGRQLGWPA